KVGGNADQGAAYVFVRAGTAWTQQQELTAADGAAGDFFGGGVAVSGDTAVGRARCRKGGGNVEQGGAYVFRGAGTARGQRQEPPAADGAANDNFGVGVAVRGDTAVVGADLHQVGSNVNRGAAYVFVRAGTAWTQQQELTASDGAANDFFGLSVAVSGDTAVVGADLHQVGSNVNQGAAYVFVRAGTAWAQQQELTASDGAANDFFGLSLAVSGDTAVAGAAGHKVGSNVNQGAAYVFVRAGTTWSQQRKLTAADGTASDHFGVSVAVSGDTAVVGAEFHKVGSNAAQGAAYLQNWTQATAKVTVLVTTPGAVTATAGGGQSATITPAFANPLVATVTDAHGVPVPGVTVTFAAPGTGPSGSFPDSATFLTDANGLATVPRFVANGTPGSYQVTATADLSSN